MREVGSGIYNPARFWLHAGRNGHDWPYPKRFRVGFGMSTGDATKTIKQTDENGATKTFKQTTENGATKTI